MKTKYNIETINKQTISQIRQLVEDSLSVILEDNNLRMELGNASYDNDSVKFTGFRISLANALTPEEKALKQELGTRTGRENARPQGYGMLVNLGIVVKRAKRDISVGVRG